MPRFIALVFPLLLTPFAAQAADPQLFQLSIANEPVENGKVLNMKFQEVAREADASTVQITRHSGGLSSSMFVMRAMCALARSRGKRNFVPERVAGESGSYTVTFPETPPTPGTGFTIAQCELMRY